MGFTFRGVTWASNGEHAAESAVRQAPTVEAAHAASVAMLAQYQAVEIRAADGRLERVVVR